MDIHLLDYREQTQEKFPSILLTILLVGQLVLILGELVLVDLVLANILAQALLLGVFVLIIMDIVIQIVI